MTEPEASKTALGAAVLRAVHQLVDATPRILDDPVILQILSPSALDGIRADPARYQTPRSLGLRSHAVIRSRYAEDRLAQAVPRGARQLLILGAGFDTFPYRQPAWAKDLHIFEVDHPATQREKLARLQTAAIAIPPNVEYVAIDFEATSLADGLRASQFDFTQPAFVSWLGVLVYLSQEAADAVFRFATRLPPPSEIVFTFSTPLPSQEKPGRRAPSLADRVAQLDEPFKYLVTPADLTSHLQDLGYSDVSIPTQAEIQAWYIQDRQDGLYAAQRPTLASAQR